MATSTRSTRRVRIGALEIGADRPVAVQSMLRHQDARHRRHRRKCTSSRGRSRHRSIAVDNEKEVAALRDIRGRPTASTLSVDLERADPDAPGAPCGRPPWRPTLAEALRRRNSVGWNRRCELARERGVERRGSAHGAPAAPIHR